LALPASGPPVLAVCGLKNTGKTTLLTKLIPILTGQGLMTAVIKHDGHEFEADVPGTDTWRLARAGAYGVGIYSAGQYLVRKKQSGTQAFDLAAFFPEADLILLEGGKTAAWPKIEIWRRGLTRELAGRPPHWAVCTDDDNLSPEDLPAGVPVLSLDDPESLARLILTRLG
jgi:molybdopterin-guanine dinucleotide biosynthesis protein MobB